MLLTKKEFDKFKKTAADILTKDGYTIEKHILTVYPHNPDENGTEYVLSTVAVYPVVNETEAKRYNVVVGYRQENGEDKFFFHCEDNFLENGGTTIIPKETIIQKTLLDPRLLNEKGDQLENDLTKIAGGLKEGSKEAQGHFWKSWKGVNNKPCKHVNAVLTVITEDVIGEIKDLFKVFTEKPESAMKSDVTPFIAKVSKYAFRKHILVEGEKGSGKTYGLDKYVTSQGFTKEFIGGHEGIESIDLLGHLVKFSEVSEVKSVGPAVAGNMMSPAFSTATQKVYVDRMVWKDGALSAAFRKAAKGENVVLFIDEMLRIPARELNILVAALTPNSSKQYVLRTGNIIELKDGVAIEETLAAPVEKLWVVATTNVGAGYNVDEIDEALSDRFRVVRKDNNRDEIKEILSSIAKKVKLVSSVKDVMSFFDDYQKMKSKGQLTKVLNLRHLCEAIELASTPAEVTENLLDMIPVWVERTPEGYPEPSQVTIIEGLINKTVGV